MTRDDDNADEMLKGKKKRNKKKFIKMKRKK